MLTSVLFLFAEATEEWERFTNYMQDNEVFYPSDRLIYHDWTDDQAYHSCIRTLAHAVVEEAAILGEAVVMGTNEDAIVLGPDPSLDVYNAAVQRVYEHELARYNLFPESEKHFDCVLDLQQLMADVLSSRYGLRDDVPTPARTPVGRRVSQVARDAQYWLTQHQYKSQRAMEAEYQDRVRFARQQRDWAATRALTCERTTTAALEKKIAGLEAKVELALSDYTSFLYVYQGLGDKAAEIKAAELKENEDGAETDEEESDSKKAYDSFPKEKEDGAETDEEESDEIISKKAYDSFPKEDGAETDEEESDSKKAYDSFPKEDGAETDEEESDEIISKKAFDSLVKDHEKKADAYSKAQAAYAKDEEKAMTNREKEDGAETDGESNEEELKAPLQA